MRFLHTKGFTILELLITLTIIVILFSLVLMLLRPREIFEQTDEVNILNDKSDIKVAYIKYKLDRDGAVPFDSEIFNGVLYKICREEVEDCNMDDFEISLNKLKDVRLLTKIPVHPSDSDVRYTGYSFVDNRGDILVLSDSEISYAPTNTPPGQCFTYKSLQYCVVVGDDGNLWLDRNLGATTVAAASTTATSYGDLYQWGRSTDGHQIRTSSTSIGPSSALVPGANFLTRPGIPYNWYNGINVDNLWQNPNYINSICPESWRIPSSAEWHTEINNWASENEAGAIASLLKLPSSGRRNYDATLTEVGTMGYYATSSHNLATNTAKTMRFTNTLASPSYSLERAQGVAVRCFKGIDDDYTQSTGVYSVNTDSLDNCIDPTISGTYNDGVAMNSSHTVELEVYVTSIGSYYIATNTVNGMQFSKSGTFASTGYTSVVLDNNAAAPVSAGTSIFSASAGTSTCSFPITIV